MTKQQKCTTVNILNPLGESISLLAVQLNIQKALLFTLYISRAPFATRSRMELQFHPAPGSKRSSKLHKMYQCRCMAKNSWWWAERLPETCRVVIPIKLEFSASVGFIHKEKVMELCCRCINVTFNICQCQVSFMYLCISAQTDLWCHMFRAAHSQPKLWNITSHHWGLP